MGKQKRKTARAKYSRPLQNPTLTIQDGFVAAGSSRALRDEPGTSMGKLGHHKNIEKME
jgi:hypothetical protein